MLFRGEHWESTDELRTIKSIFLDMYTGDTSSKMIDLNNGLSHVMVFTLVGTPSAPCRILLNVYNIELKKSNEQENVPKVDLVEMGPRVEFVQRRCMLANAELIKESLRVPKLNAVRYLSLLFQHRLTFFFASFYYTQIAKETKEYRNERVW